MKASVITVGDEILIGQVLDTNSQYVAHRLTKIGWDMIDMLTVSDDDQEIVNALEQLMKTSDLVILTGGLGPTKDDLTKKVLTEYFGGHLVYNEEVMSWLEDRLRRRNIPMNDNIRTQSIVPDNCKLLHNFAGTASGMWWERDGKIVISLPGVPNEMEHLTDTYIIPELSRRYPDLLLDYRVIKCYGIGESQLAMRLESWETRLRKIEGLGLAYLPTMGMVKLRITAKGRAVNVLDEWFGTLCCELQGIKTIEGDNTNEEEVNVVLRRKSKTIATAESCTGGNIAHLLTSVPGSSVCFKGGIVAYDNSVKEQVLGVCSNDLATNGVVSEVVVRQMAEGVRRLLTTDYAIATSGIAGPDGGTDEKPVGTVWVAVATPTKVVTKLFNLPFNRARNIEKASEKALELLLQNID